MNDVVSITEVLFHQKVLLRNLLTEYLEELLAIIKEEIDTSYPYFDAYFTDENRTAYFIKNQEKIIGFCMINDYCVIEDNEIAIAEFYIQKEFRKKGFGLEATKQIFKLSDKKWEVKTSLKNENALVFWREVIGNCSEKIIAEEVIFSFIK